VRRARGVEGAAAQTPLVSSLEPQPASAGLAPQTASCRFRIPKRMLDTDTAAPLEPPRKLLRELPLPPAGPSMPLVLQEPLTQQSQIQRKREQSPANAACTAPTDTADRHLAGLPLSQQWSLPRLAGPGNQRCVRPLREAQARATSAAAAAVEAFLRQPYRAGAISKQQYKDACRGVVRAVAAQLALSWSSRDASHATSTAADNESAEARAAVMQELCVMLPNVFANGAPSDVT
jgi:hypothetical protein